MAPQMWMLAASISFLEKPRAGSISKVKSLSSLVGEAEHVAAEILAERELVEDELDVEGRLAAPVLSVSMFSSVKPLAFSEAGLIAGAWSRLPWPTA